MFRGLRLRLTLLYLMAAAVLIALIGWGTVRLLRAYLDATTDLALQHEMAEAFRSVGQPLPPELAAADVQWRSSREASPALPPTGLSTFLESEGEDGERSAEATPGTSLGREEEAYDGELAAIFVVPVSAEGPLPTGADTTLLPLDPDMEAISAAQATGHDLRTVTLTGGGRVRLLTYVVGGSAAPAVIQLGRTLDDHDRILGQLVEALVGLGGAGAVLLSLGSWWLAGRSLQPAQKAWDNQRKFVTNAGHELRTPLTLIRATAEMARRGTTPDHPHNALLGDILQECDHMGRLVNDLLTLSRLDAHRLELSHQAVGLADMLSAIQRQVAPMAQAHGVEVTLVSTAGVAWGDPTRLRQVVLALFDNALRHTPAGGAIRLSSRQVGHRVEFTVADTGEGIAPEHAPHVFERFYQTSHKGDGVGLGLAIAKALVEAHGGQIALDSQPGSGTTVTVRLPAARAG